MLDELMALKMPGMAAALRHQWATPSTELWTFEDRLAALLNAERSRRATESASRFVKQAGMPQPAHIADIDHRVRRGLARPLVESLARCDWIRRQQNVLITGPTGIGKTFLACALGMEAAKAGLSVVYHKTPALIDALAVAKEDGRLASLRARISRTQLLILDDWAVDTMTAAQAHEVRRLVEAREGKTSTLVASPLPVEAWHSRIEDASAADALTDRLVRCSHHLVLDGPSMRTRKPSSV